MPDNEAMSDPEEPERAEEQSEQESAEEQSDQEMPGSLTPAPMFVEMNIVDPDDTSIPGLPEFTTTPLTREEMDFLLQMAREQTVQGLIREESKLKAAGLELKRVVTLRFLAIFTLVTMSTLVMVGMGVISASAASTIIGATGIVIVLRHFFPKNGDKS